MKLPQLKTTFALLVVGVAATAIFTPGCHGDPVAQCNDICTRSQKCTGAQPQDCSQFCTNATNLADASGCTSSYDDTESCETALSDVCTAPTNCSQQRASLLACTGAYCLQHANDQACKAFTGG